MNTMENPNNIFDYFKLFQEQNQYSEKLLGDAKKIKQSIQEIYENVILLENQEDNDFWILDFDINLTQVSEKPEPDALKLFTRQYTPIVNIYKNNAPQCEPIKFTDETKYIHKHINELFVGDSISQEYFFDIAQQYFLLDFVYRQIKNEKFTTSFVSKIKEFCNDYEETKQTVICVNCKLRGRKMPDKINPNLHSAISHINTLWGNLAEQSSFIIIGNYINYLNEDELIIQLNKNNLISIPGKISDFFQNDFLLLNNMEFMNEKPYTIKWNNIIIPPSLLKKDGEKYHIKDIFEIIKTNEQIFLFQKIKPDGKFYKTEIHIPNKDISQDYFNKIITMSMKLLKLKSEK